MSDGISRTGQLILSLEEQQKERLLEPPTVTPDGRFNLTPPTTREMETGISLFSPLTASPFYHFHSNADNIPAGLSGLTCKFVGVGLSCIMAPPPFHPQVKPSQLVATTTLRKAMGVDQTAKDNTPDTVSVTTPNQISPPVTSST